MCLYVRVFIIVNKDDMKFDWLPIIYVVSCTVLSTTTTTTQSKDCTYNATSHTTILITFQIYK